MLEADLTRLALGPLFLICLGVVFYRRERNAARLFMVIGVLHVLGGAWVGREPPAWLGWELIAINLIAAALYPKGGFWLVMIPSFLIIREARNEN